MIQHVPDQRMLQSVAGTLRWTNLDENGEETAAAGAVTVAVVNEAGTTVLASGSASLASNTRGTYTRSMTAANTASLGLLTATWTDAGDSSTHTTRIEVVGGYLFTLGDARASHPTLASLTLDDWLALYPVVVDEVEWICDRYFTPRGRTVTLDGNADIVIDVPDNDIRSVTAVTVDGSAYTSAQLAALTFRDGKIVQPTATGAATWSYGQANVTISYTAGMDAPPRALRDAVLERLRTRYNRPKSGIPDRATRLNITELGTMELATAGVYKTGYPEIDAVYSRWSKRTMDGKASPASGAVDFTPQAGSLYHGWRS